MLQIFAQLRRLLTLLLIPVALFGCNNAHPITPLTCDLIGDPKLFAAPLDSHDVSAMSKWVQDQYDITENDLHIPAYTTGAQAIEWSSTGRAYYALLVGGSYIDMRWESIEPSLENVLQCFGPPAFYQSERTPTADGGYFYSLDVWYPVKGIVFSRSQQSPSFSAATKIDKMRITKPDTMTNMLRAVYPAGSFPVYSTLKSVKPWPGNGVGGIVTGIDPMLE